MLWDANLLMVAATKYNFEMVTWILTNLDIDIDAVNAHGENVQQLVIIMMLEDFIERDRPLLLKMLELLLDVGKANPTTLWMELLPWWDKEISTLKIGEEEMLQDFIKTLFLRERPSLLIENALQATRHGHLVDEANKLRPRLVQRKAGLNRIIDEHFPPVLNNLVRAFDDMTTDEMWAMDP
jgi:hypothetical protein